MSLFWSFLLGGGLFVIVGLFKIIRQKIKEKKCTMFVMGVVKNNVKNSSKADATVYYHPEFEYIVDGQTITDVYFGGTARIKYKIGEKIGIYYNPNNYKEYYVEGDKLLSRVAIFFMILGIIFVVISFFLKNI